ncbi:MAG: hypothetical protein AABX95_02025 [Nanoarchaeota archaeon]
MFLKYYLDQNKERIYTLKDKHNSKETAEAHYKFIKFTQDPNKEP